MLGYAVLMTAVYHTQGEEQHAPAVAYASLHNGNDGQVIGNLEPGETEGEDGDLNGDGVVVEPLVAVVEQQVEDEEDDACHKQCPEEPEGPCQELVVATHREDDVDHPLPELEPIVGVGHTAIPIAELLVHQPDLEEQIVEDEEEQAPLDKGYIQALETLLAEGPGVGEVFLVKEIACRDKEHRHVEQIDEGHQQGWSLGMAGAHQYNGNRLTNRQCGVIAFHERSCNKNV